MMTDLFLPFGGDLAVGPSGDLRLSDGPELTQQRVLRRLLTNPGDYIWQLDYGAGLGQYVGQPGAAAAIAGVTRAQLRRETAVASAPAPEVTVTAQPDGVVDLTLSYADAAAGEPSELTFSL
jgi:phage baseplate assembly protein W